MESFLQEANNNISEALSHLKKELASIRAGRANPTLIENIPVPAYGSTMKLMEVGTISAPQHSLLTVSIWDPSLTQAVEKAILEANIGLNPAVDGQTIKLPIPPLTEERREEFVKMTQQKGEHVKVEIRQIRQDERSKYLSLKDSGEFGEDEFFRREKLLQELVDRSITEVDNEIKIKESELRQI